MPATTTKPRRRRRTKDEMRMEREMGEHKRASEWHLPLVVWEGYAGYRACASCGEVRHCRGKTYDAQQCKDCYITGAPLRRA